LKKPSGSKPFLEKPVTHNRISEAEYTPPELDQDMTLKAGGDQLGLRRVATVNKPKEPSVETLIEMEGGWQKGLRAKFDRALLTNDIKEIKRLLPDVPTEYKARFASELTELLGKGWDKLTK
jgi:hypothetical protein